MALFKDFVVKQGIVAEGIAESQSTATGTLIIGGGAGFGGSINVAGSIKRIGDVTGKEHSAGAQLSLRDGTFTDSLVSGRTAWGVVNYFGSSVLDTISESATYTNAASVFIKGAPSAGTNLTIEKAWSLYITSGTVFIGETTGNTASSSSQALIVAGGISFNNGLYGRGGGSLYGPFSLNDSEILTRATANQGLIEFPDGIRITTSTQSYSTVTGALIVDRNGGAGIGGNLYVGGYFAGLTTGTFQSTVNSVSTSSGALTVAGGLGVGADLYAENGFFVSGLASTSTVANNSVQITNNGGLGVSGSARVEGQFWISNTTDSTPTESGALVVAGGATIQRNLTGDTAKFQGTLVATDSTSAAFIVAGGVGIGKNLIIGSTATSTGTAGANALQVAGGGYFGGDLKVDGSTVIRGDLILLGTATQVTVNSTNTYIVDPLIEIGGGADGTILTIPDIYDKGLLIHYQNAVNTVTDYRAFLGFENTNERFILKQNIAANVGGDDPYGDYYNSGTWSTLEVGSLIVRDATTGTDAVTGAIVVTGGISVNGGSLFANTVTNSSYAWSLTGIENNAIQIPNGGIGAQYAYFSNAVYVNGAEVVTTGTVNAGIGGIFTNTFRFTNLTESWSTDTGAVIVDGGLGVGGNVNVGKNFVTTGTIHSWSTQDSANTLSGALVVDGGVGVGLRLNVGGQTKILDTSSSTTSDTGALVVTGGAGVGGDVYIGGQVTAANTATSNKLRVLSVENSTDKTSGAAVIDGGLGVAETINAKRVVAETAFITSGSNSISTTTGDLVVIGGVGIGKDTWIGGRLRVESTQTSYDVTSGAIVTDGGLGVVKDVTIGGTLTRTGQVSKNSWGTAGIGLALSSSTYVDLATIGGNAGTLAVHSVGRPTVIGSLNPNWNDLATVYIDNSPLLSGGATSSNTWSFYVANGNVRINTGSSNLGNTTTGALQVNGGVGVGGNLTVGGVVKTTEVLVGNIADALLNKITSVSISGKNNNTPVLIDTYIGNEFTTAKYLVQVTDLGSPNKFHVVEIMVTYDGSGASAGVYISQYGLITNLGELGTFDIDYVAGDIQIVFTPNYSPVSMNIRALRMAIVT